LKPFPLIQPPETKPSKRAFQKRAKTAFHALTVGVIDSKRAKEMSILSGAWLRSQEDLKGNGGLMGRLS